MGLDSVELLMDLEEEFGITIGDADVEQLVTVGDLHACILKKLSEADRAGIDAEPGDVWTRLSTILVKRYAIDPTAVRAEARVAKDLRLN